MMRYNSKYILYSIIAIISIIFLFTAGTDIFLHVRNIEVYHEMMADKTIHMYDPDLGENSFLYPYGYIAYILGGLIWPILGKYSIKIIEFALFWILFYYTKDKIKNKIWYILILLVILLFDSYVYFVSVVLFHLSLVAKGRLKDMLQVLAGINHPHVSIINLFMISRKRIMFSCLTILTIIVQYIVISYLFFYDEGVGFEPLYFVYFIWRTLVLIYPIIPKWIYKLPKLNPRIIATAILIGVASVQIGNALTDLGIQNLSICFHEDKYDDIPYLPGNIRVVDHCRSWLYVMPDKGISIATGQWYSDQEIDRYWTEEDYVKYLKVNKINYVVHCTDCYWPVLTTESGAGPYGIELGKISPDLIKEEYNHLSQLKLVENNELKLLENNYKLVYETNEYKIFSVKPSFKPEITLS